MAVELGYLCSSCSERHEGLPFGYGALAPAFWSDDMAGRPGHLLTDEQCVIDREHFFVRARLLLPVIDVADELFDWGVWVSLSQENFARTEELWTNPERVNEPPYFGWLSTELPVYEPSTVNLKAMLHSQPVGRRPILELEPTDHPLAVEQLTGITVARVQEIAERLLHS